MAEKTIYEVDENGNVTAEYVSQHEAAAANGITQPAVRKSCDHGGAIVQKCGKGFLRKFPGAKRKKAPEGPRCGICKYSAPLGGGICCDYLNITGHRRPVRAAECELWREPQEKEPPKPKRKATRAEAKALTAIIMGKEKK